ncbi:histidine kinase,Response regulator receiver domain protein,histidine kinase [Nostoc sp. PCC 7524]|uniref:ATP-binding protein n=1 Tax=Nostoc sp. (strain ATCC 29411 / PCC 7524) TaxID=28072 RepID=UPI00029F4392|nr:ATP-binding protein [Nostoc sp. PCC 7524]AFY48757.1 histidine kinase,Response regulator receiver domain protein,histidine kinase [Nostoc sp. PCC 7524]
MKLESISLSPENKQAVPNYLQVNTPESALSGGNLNTDQTTVILIDDQLIIGEAVCRILSSDSNISFHYLSDPTQAIQQAIALSPTVILLDMVMPEMDGLMLLRWFRSHPATRDIPIVMLSSKEEAKLKADAFAEGANDYLIKLPDPVELIARIRYHSKAYNNLKALTNTTINAQLQAQKLEHTLRQLQTTQVQLVQTEKMSGLGRMVAGLAHEINNPINFINGNFKHLSNYIESLVDLINFYQQEYPELTSALQEKIIDINLEFIIEDIPKLLASMKLGTERISEIVSSLRNFSRLDQAGKKSVNIHEGIESTLLLLKHRIRQEIKIIKEYGNLPLIECYPAELNQVFMNILSNAIDAVLEQHDKSQEKEIFINTEITDYQTARITITDNGVGINPEIQSKIFDPFFTTKPVNKGIGLGLSISYQIIQEHQGDIKVKSELGQGTEFILEIPVTLSKQ